MAEKVSRSSSEDSDVAKVVGPTPGKPDIAPVSNDSEKSHDNEERSKDSESASSTSSKHGNEHSLPELSKARKIILTASLTGASFLNTASVQAVVIILPTIARDLAIPPARQQWILTAYSLPVACFVLLWASIADIFGRRLVFLIGSAITTIFLLINPFIANEVGFDVTRAVHGLGAAANVPTAIGILGYSFPPGPAKTYAITCFSAGFPLGAVFGNILGGVLGQYAGWHWVFWLLAIIAAMVTVFGFFTIPSGQAPIHASAIHRKVDFLGGALITLGLLCLLLAMTWGNIVGWSTSWIIVLLIISVILITAFAIWDGYLERTGVVRPLMKVSIWRNPRFMGIQLIMAFFFASFNTLLYYATLFYQNVQELSVIQTTLRFIPTGVMGIFGSLIASQLLSRVKGLYLILFGCVLCAISCLLFAAPIPTSTSYWAYAFEAMGLSALGTDVLYPCLILFTVQSLPPEEQAVGGGIVNAMGQIGRAISLAVATAIQIAVQGSHAQPTSKEALLKGYRAAQYFSFACAAAGCAIAIIFLRGAGVIGVRKGQKS